MSQIIRLQMVEPVHPFNRDLRFYMEFGGTKVYPLNFDIKNFSSLERAEVRVWGTLGAEPIFSRGGFIYRVNGYDVLDVEALVNYTTPFDKTTGVSIPLQLKEKGNTFEGILWIDYGPLLVPEFGVEFQSELILYYREGEEPEDGITPPTEPFDPVKWLQENWWIPAGVAGGLIVLYLIWPKPPPVYVVR